MHDLSAVVDQAIHPIDVCALHGDLTHVDLGCVNWAEHRCTDAGTHRVGSQSRARIAVSRHRQVGQAQLFGHRYRDTQAPCFEGSCRQTAFILDQQVLPYAYLGCHELAQIESIVRVQNRQ